MGKEIISGIYIMISPSFKIYIGKTVDFYKRYTQYKNLHIKSQRKINSSILHYGFEFHNMTLIHRCPKEELYFWESFYCKLFDCVKTEHGLNWADPIDNYREYRREFKNKSESHKKSISNSLKGHPCYKDESRRENLKKSAKPKYGKDNPNFGKSQSADVKEKISKTLKKYIKENGPTGKVFEGKKIARFKEDFYEEFNSFKIASQVSGLDDRIIRRRINKKTTDNFGYYWKEI